MLEDAGLAERIGTRRTSREYGLSIAGPGGEPRELALFVSLRAVEDRASGGAQITTSQTHATIYPVPSPLGGDPAATVRLFPHVSLEADM